MTIRALAIDIGSNAVRAAIGELDEQGKLKIIQSLRDSVRLGREVFSDGKVSDSTIKSLTEALSKFQKSGKELGVSLTRAVATSAMREVRNDSEILEAITKELRLPIEIISGEEEARLASRIVKTTLDISSKRAVLIDIGGGSMEMSILDDGEIVLSESIKVGSVRLLGIKPALLPKMVAQYSRSLLGRIKEQLDTDRKLDLVIGCGGNCEAILGLRTSLLKKKDDATAVSVSEMKEILQTLTPLSISDRIEKYGLRADRADVIIPALVVLSHAVESIGGKALEVPRVGLKEGVLLELLESQQHKPTRSIKQVVGFAEQLVKRFRGDLKHARTVTQFALALYDSLPGTKTTDEERLYLRVASLLHDLGQCISPESHHKHTYYILQQTPFVGISLKEKEIIAQVARYHRKAVPSKKHDFFTRLSQEDQEKVQKLASLLRIAEALDQEHSSGIRSITAACSATELIITLEGDGDFDLERSKAKKRSDLFEAIYKRDVIIR